MWYPVLDDRRPKPYLVLAAKLGKMCKSFPSGTDSEGSHDPSMKGSWRTAEPRHHEKPGEAIGECATSVEKGASWIILNESIEAIISIHFKLWSRTWTLVPALSFVAL